MAGGGGLGALIRFAQGVRSWIAALSPAGAVAHDTGWGTASSGSLFARYRRVGMGVEVRWSHSTALAAGASANFSQIIPAGWRPSNQNAVFAVRSDVSGSNISSELGTEGTIAIRNTGTAATGSPFRGTTFFLVDA